MDPNEWEGLYAAVIWYRLGEVTEGRGKGIFWDMAFNRVTIVQLWSLEHNARITESQLHMTRILKTHPMKRGAHTVYSVIQKLTYRQLAF